MKRWIRLAGIILALIAGGFFIYRARQALAGQDISALFDARNLLACLVLTFLYALAVPITGLAWTWLLRMLGEDASFGRLSSVLAVTQFGKYLPGNVAQHIGRIGMARSEGIALTPIVLSITYETLLSVVACAHISALTFLWKLPPTMADWAIVKYRYPLLALITAGAFLAFLTVPRLAARIATLRTKRAGEATPSASGRPIRWNIILGCYFIYIANFFLTGMGLWILAHAFLGTTDGAPSLLFMTGAFASTWIFGFLAPGAPAGLGVREGILAAWLGGVMQPSQAIMLILGLRVATTLGDLLNFLGGSAVMAWQRKHAAQSLVRTI